MKESYHRISTHEKLFTKRPGKSTATDVGGHREEPGDLRKQKHSRQMDHLHYKPKSEKSR